MSAPTLDTARAGETKDADTVREQVVELQTAAARLN